MKCRSILNYLSISINLLYGYVISINETGLGGLAFEDPDTYWPINQQHSPTYSNENYSEFFNSTNAHEPAMTSTIQLPSTLNEIEDTFIKLNYWSPLPWKEVQDNDTVLLKRICFAAWNDFISDKQCESIAKPYKGSDTSRLNVEFFESKLNIKPLGANMLRCKCYPEGMKRDQVRSNIKPLYLAKHNDLSVFLLKLKDDGNFCRLKIIGMMPINLNDIVSSSNRTSSPLTWNLTQAEKEFYIMYNNFSDALKWQVMRDNNTAMLQKICIAAWEEGSNKKCYAELRLYKAVKHNSIKAKMTDNCDTVTVHGDFLMCKCSSVMSKDEIRHNIDPIYFARYNNTTVFKLSLEGKGSHNLKVDGFKTLNMTI